MDTIVTLVWASSTGFFFSHICFSFYLPSVCSSELLCWTQKVTSVISTIQFLFDLANLKKKNPTHLAHTLLFLSRLKEAMLFVLVHWPALRFWSKKKERKRFTSQRGSGGSCSMLKRGVNCSRPLLHATFMAVVKFGASLNSYLMYACTQRTKKSLLMHCLNSSRVHILKLYSRWLLPIFTCSWSRFVHTVQ